MVPLPERLKRPGAVVADGAMGTMLLARGLEPGQCPERLCLERPGILTEIAARYLEAGAEIVQTNTFGASPIKLALYGLEKRTEEINQRAVAAARQAAGDRAYVSVSCGPSGNILEPYGDTPPDAVFESFRRQLQAAIAEGPDMVCIETMTDLNEAILAVKAARSVSATIPVCATMTFDATPRGFYTIMGTTITQAATGLAGAGADIVGSNCGNGIAAMIEIAREFTASTSLPVIIQSNAGVPALRDGRPEYPETPEYMAEKSLELKWLGVKIIGGCCGTTPAHTAALARALGADSK